MFSVIVPVHNGEKTLRRCVESLASQVSCILLIENGSKDGSRQLCHALAEEFSNVTALDGDAVGGVSKARNLGLRHARTPYILFCDCDDYVEPDYAESFQNALENAEFAICGYINHDEVANGRTDVYGFAADETVELLPRLEKVHEACLLQQLWNKVFSREVIEQAGVRFDETISIGEDMRFVLDYLAAAKPEKTALIARPLYHYMRDQPGSLMYRMGTEKMEEAIRNLEAMYRLAGMEEADITKKLAWEREHQKELYAYLIMHNMGMPMGQRRKLILKLDEHAGRQLWRKNLVLYIKETISRVCKRSAVRLKRCSPLWVKAPIAVLLKETGKWPFGLVFAHMQRSFAESGGCGEEGLYRAWKGVQRKTYQYIKNKYGQFVEDQEISLGVPEANPPIWVFWWQGEENAPLLIQRCIQSIRRHASGHPVKVVDQHNYMDFVSLPPHILQKREAGIISLTHFSDILRMALLAEYGGLWLDATIYVTGSLERAFQGELFTVRNPNPEDENISHWEWSVFAMGGSAGCSLFSKVRDLLYKYWQDNDFLVDYYVFDYMVRLVVDNCPAIRETLNEIESNNRDIYYYQQHFSESADQYTEKDTWLYKLSWKGSYDIVTPTGEETLYGRWLRESEGL